MSCLPTYKTRRYPDVKKLSLHILRNEINLETKLNEFLGEQVQKVTEEVKKEIKTESPFGKATFGNINAELETKPKTTPFGKAKDGDINLQDAMASPARVFDESLNLKMKKVLQRLFPHINLQYTTKEIKNEEGKYNQRRLASSQKEAKNLFFNEVYGQDLSNFDISRINRKLKRISDYVGDVPWHLSLNRAGTGYNIVGYNNRIVTFEEYYSPFAEGTFYQQDNINKDRILGQADIKAGTVLIDAIHQKQDTLPHEYAHHYIAWFRDTKIVQEGIKRFGSEEKLVQAIGEDVTAKFGEGYTWWKKFTNWLTKVVTNLGIVSDKELLDILSNAFMSNENLSKLKNESQTNYQKAQNIEGKYDDVSSPFEKLTRDEQVAFEKTIRDLAARISHRIGIPYKIINRKDLKYKGKIENGTAYINLAYATKDTPIHEILGHPIIKSIKGNQLYQNLLKELEYGKGKEVLDRVKRDYQYKEFKPFETTVEKYDDVFSTKEYQSILDYAKKEGFYSEDPFGTSDFTKNKEFELNGIKYKTTDKGILKAEKYTSEEQQEEAVVELVSLMTADRLDKIQDAKLISLLKKLLKEMKAFMRSLINQKEIDIDSLPDNMTLNDLSDLLAYSNSFLILPGNEVNYRTPDNQTFKTYQEASNHISELTKLGEVDLDNVKLEYSNIITNIEELNNLGVTEFSTDLGDYIKINNEWHFKREDNNYTNRKSVSPLLLIPEWNSQFKDFDSSMYLNGINTIKGFINKNKEYEQSKKIIEEWKKVNDIKYDPEEVYSRGQGFYSVIGAYSDFDVELMFQNLLAHIEDNKKAGGEFTISAFTKPVNKKISHLEGGGGEIKFKIFPKSNDIKWAANTDVYSGSVWDASEKVSKDTKSEIIGVSYTKAPSLNNINSIQPNLAAIIDNLAHHHNELGIELTGNNFRLEYDDNIPYSTKKIINSINSILDQKYGKLVKPEIKKRGERVVQYGLFSKGANDILDWFDTKEEAQAKVDESNKQLKNLGEPADYSVKPITKPIGIQPTQTIENLKESIESLLYKPTPNKFKIEADNVSIKDKWYYKQDNQWYIKYTNPGDSFDSVPHEDSDSISEMTAKDNWNDNFGKKDSSKEYTSQAKINTIVAALKYGQRKFPRSLIRSEVKKIDKYSNQSNNNETALQKIPSKTEFKGIPLIIVDGIENNEGNKGAAKKTPNGTIQIDRSFLKEKFEEKAWTKPRALKDIIYGTDKLSYSKALPLDQFKNYNEWELFVLEHKYAHTQYTRKDFIKDNPGKLIGDYETMINDMALKAISESPKTKPFNLAKNLSKLEDISEIIDKSLTKNGLTNTEDVSKLFPNDAENIENESNLKC